MSDLLRLNWAKMSDANLQPQAMTKQPSDAGKKERKAGLNRNCYCLRVMRSQLLDLVACIDAMRNKMEAAETTPAPPATDQNKMLPPDQAPT
jgi:hypothetical protein